ncbi:hypothetical protein CISIN_1g0015552mg, partial [Citrus sinensis]
EACGSCKC